MEIKIDRGFFDTQNAYRKMLIGESVNESRGLDEETYKAYIVVKCKDGTEKIESGWEFSEDAKDRKNELKEDGISSKSVSRRYLKSVGLDPSDDSNWLKGNVSILAAVKDGGRSDKRVVESEYYDDSYYQGEIELLDCPFCGGICKIRKGVRYGFWPLCTGCGASFSNVFDTPEEAADMWNRRV